ncbi:lytic transglycosylase domain-containing protein [Sphingomonas nostoxanthinifaciens]|uniref:lytic transglycosylase domain-containing protein n=1 Tax=Sphingomonas nostoxanthinifaciens TaxID=2872652 RepID=UPI001CC1C437|nr:lytic transglycosylase domain-containing protein [Sphingomonas nostoxanthinifaciens]UAK23169.1 lytic transglycosylase domain-containing protein [Sphingomonas nostoxanthinifaciens]
MANGILLELLLASAVASAAAGPAMADVFEVAADGVVHARGVTAQAPWSIRDADAAPDDGDRIDAPQDGALPNGAMTLVGAPEAPERFRSALLDAARRYDVSPSLLAALVWHESRWQPAALSSKGAIGLAQLMPATARALAVDPHDAGANLAGAAHYLRQMLDLFDGDVERALAAYDAGPARVLKANGIPPIAETRTYVASIIDRLGRSDAASVQGDVR